MAFGSLDLFQLSVVLAAVFFQIFSTSGVNSTEEKMTADQVENIFHQSPVVNHSETTADLHSVTLSSTISAIPTKLASNSTLATTGKTSPVAVPIGLNQTATQAAPKAIPIRSREDSNPDDEASKQQEKKTNVADVAEGGGKEKSSGPTAFASDSGFSEEPPTNSHFLAYVVVIGCLCVIAYVVVHRKNQIIGLIVEGRKSRSERRRDGYRRLPVDASADIAPKDVIY